MSDTVKDLSINIDKDAVRTMGRDLEMARRASKDLANVGVQTQEDARLSELIKTIEQRQAFGAIVEQSELPVKRKTASVVPKMILQFLFLRRRPICLPLKLLQRQI